ncbi:heavy metal sensor histidine kinase [Pseudomonas turukhanskensis]|uniref:Sensor protein n=1 Tax=Pseudomonas turukhanskensis TaxID=1806536 RepID=A0A9W6K6Y1_9PSED|nr:heavy metal sensor histidine kinase [Pseudomonas turukhanskensis]GLK89361.1 two-component sensor histidine kinase [Pseudomonas turukhanskensis]
MKRWAPSALSVRLALMFALVSMLLLGAIGFYLYHALHKEIAWRDDQALLGRVQRMQAILTDSRSIEALRERPQLYENMLGNRDNLLWVVDAAGQVLIEINPPGLPRPTLPATATAQLADDPNGAPLRLAWQNMERGEQRLTLIAGKVLSEREQMLAAYRLKLGAALGCGMVLAFALGWLVSQRGLRPVRELAQRTAAIDSQHLHLRLDEYHSTAELQALSQALNHMLARLEGGFGQLSRFCEDLAHEMRTPLSNLMGHTQQTLQRERTVAVYEDLLVSNQEEYERLARMIDSMLFLARTEQAALNVQPVDLHALGEQLCEYFEGMAEERGVVLRNEADGELLADADLLRRALANLLANALRYGAPGQPITLSTRREGERLAVSVHNLGPVIGVEHLPHLFERFYRCDPSRAQPGDSGGLGLAIVRSIMQAHGGEVRVRSDEGGTAFVLVFAA